MAIVFQVGASTNVKEVVHHNSRIGLNQPSTRVLTEAQQIHSRIVQVYQALNKCLANLKFNTNSNRIASKMMLRAVKNSSQI